MFTLLDVAGKTIGRFLGYRHFLNNWPLFGR